MGLGSSPRVRSGPFHVVQFLPPDGIISACAERSPRRFHPCGGGWDHLRVCGAVRSTNDSQDNRTGSSPRVRSGRSRFEFAAASPGIISACAERSGRRSAADNPRSDHLRVCGAVGLDIEGRAVPFGSSPRVRSGRRRRSGRRIRVRIISACAERSTCSRSSWSVWWDHLRVCGAVTKSSGGWCPMTGSSPRVRSGQRCNLTAKVSHRIISACAERSTTCPNYPPWIRDHLRVCGAVGFEIGVTRVEEGSSPRVRSGQICQATRKTRRGIISACAERSRWRRPMRKWTWDHLRVCGAVRA